MRGSTTHTSYCTVTIGAISNGAIRVRPLSKKKQIDNPIACHKFEPRSPPPPPAPFMRPSHLLLYYEHAHAHTSARPAHTSMSSSARPAHTLLLPVLTAKYQMHDNIHRARTLGVVRTRSRVLCECKVNRKRRRGRRGSSTQCCVVQQSNVRRCNVGVHHSS